MSISNIVPLFSHLPIRSVLALATRSARRAVPLYALWLVRANEKPQLLQSLLEVVDNVDMFVQNDTSVLAEEKSLQSRVRQAHRVALSYGDDWAVQSSFRVLSVRACACFVRDHLNEPSCKRHLNLVIEYAEAAVSSVAHYGLGPLKRDAEGVSNLRLGRFPDYGQSFDPSESGPLGSLWDGEAPAWYSEGSQIIAYTLHGERK